MLPPGKKLREALGNTEVAAPRPATRRSYRPRLKAATPLGGQGATTCRSMQAEKETSISSAWIPLRHERRAGRMLTSSGTFAGGCTATAGAGGTSTERFTGT